MPHHPSPPAFQVAKHPTSAPINPEIVHHFFDMALPLGLVQKNNMVLVGRTKDIQLLSELGCTIEEWISPHKLGQFAERLERMSKHLLPKSSDRVSKLVQFFHCCHHLGHGLKVMSG